jgi:hypothetical protein
MEPWAFTASPHSYQCRGWWRWRGGLSHCRFGVCQPEASSKHNLFGRRVECPNLGVLTTDFGFWPLPLVQVSTWWNHCNCTHHCISLYTLGQAGCVCGCCRHTNNQDPCRHKGPRCQHWRLLRISWLWIINDYHTWHFFWDARKNI